MKKLLLSIAIVGLFTTAAHAQAAKQASSDQPTQTAEQKAIEQTQKASKQLGLSIDQESKFKGFALERINTIAPLKQKMKSSSDKTAKQATQNEIKAAREKFFSNVNAILNADQQVKWANHKKKLEEKNSDHQE